MAAQKETLNQALHLIAKEIDDRYTRVMEKMMAEDTWTEEVGERFDLMYMDFERRWGKYLHP